jgi:hypothetical protein
MEQVQATPDDPIKQAELAAMAERAAERAKADALKLDEEAENETEGE